MSTTSASDERHELEARKISPETPENTPFTPKQAQCFWIGMALNKVLYHDKEIIPVDILTDPSKVISLLAEKQDSALVNSIFFWDRYNSRDFEATKSDLSSRDPTVKFRALRNFVNLQALYSEVVRSDALLDFRYLTEDQGSDAKTTGAPAANRKIDRIRVRVSDDKLVGGQIKTIDEVGGAKEEVEKGKRDYRVRVNERRESCREPTSIESANRWTVNLLFQVSDARLNSIGLNTLEGHLDLDLMHGLGPNAELEVQLDPNWLRELLERQARNVNGNGSEPANLEQASTADNGNGAQWLINESTIKNEIIHYLEQEYSYILDRLGVDVKGLRVTRDIQYDEMRRKHLDTQAHLDGLHDGGVVVIAVDPRLFLTGKAGNVGREEIAALADVTAWLESRKKKVIIAYSGGESVTKYLCEKTDCVMNNDPQGWQIDKSKDDPVLYYANSKIGFALTDELMKRGSTPINHLPPCRADDLEVGEVYGKTSLSHLVNNLRLGCTALVQLDGPTKYKNEAHKYYYNPPEAGMRQIMKLFGSKARYVEVTAFEKEKDPDHETIVLAQGIQGCEAQDGMSGSSIRSALIKKFTEPYRIWSEDFGRNCEVHYNSDEKALVEELGSAMQQNAEKAREHIEKWVPEWIRYAEGVDLKNQEKKTYFYFGQCVKLFAYEALAAQVEDKIGRITDALTKLLDKNGGNE